MKKRLFQYLLGYGVSLAVAVFVIVFYLTEHGYNFQNHYAKIFSDAALTCDCSNVCDAFDFSGILALSFVQEICLTANGFTTNWRPVRPLPNKEDFFETVWRSYRENKNIY